MAKRVDPIPEHVWQQKSAQDHCALCQREGLPLTEHHLIPRAVHRKDRFRKRFARADMLSQKLLVCRPCHDAIHRCIPDERELAEHYATLEALLSHECLAKQVRFWRKQKVRFR